jgi:DNA polymerase-3 subunit epsilon
MYYSIIDVETTGRSNKITEISIFKFDGNSIIEEFTSLVNPQTFIPNHITSLTGIDQEMVSNAPVFESIAQQILDITEDTVFVAHNVNFDYNVIQKEFKQLDINFTRKKLCTVRLSKNLLPGFKSYSLGKLCKALQIDLVGRHRARGDAEATVTLFKKLLQQEKAHEIIQKFLNKTSKEATLPSYLPKSDYDKLPNTPGIYYFRNKKNEVIYVGKAINIKKRVTSHFYSKIQKSLDLCRETAAIDFEESGSELLALLMEDFAIKKYYPKFNVASKKRKASLALFNYIDRNGIIHLAINNSKLVTNPILKFQNNTEARQKVEDICRTFNLCPKFCHLQENVAQCSHFAISCNGICRDEESVEIYNNRVTNAICELTTETKNLVIKEKGRTPTETAFVLIRKNVYLGYGFIENDIQITNEDDLEHFLIKQNDNADIKSILIPYLS